MVDGVLLREDVLGVPAVAPVSSFHPYPVFILKVTPCKIKNGKTWKPSRKKF